MHDWHVQILVRRKLFSDSLTQSPEIQKREKRKIKRKKMHNQLGKHTADAKVVAREWAL